MEGLTIMNARNATKKIVGFTVQYGTGAITHGIIKSNVVLPPGRLDLKIAVGVASYILGGTAAKAGTEHSDKVIDSLFDLFEKVKNVTS
jgi:hypothetical protein